MFVSILKSVVRVGSLRLIDASGRIHMVGDGTVPCATVRLCSRRLAYSLAANPSLAIGEAYMDNLLTVEEGTIYDFLEILARNYAPSSHPWLSLLERISRGLKQRNPTGRARRNVAHHYDLSGELYDLFLDRDRQYSCAYFERADDTLEVAQERKKQHIAAKLLLDRPGLRILDIGSGWGGLGLYLAREACADVTGVTLSAEQHQASQARTAEADLAERVRFYLRDYREEGGRYDRVVSIGMFEHVGKRNYAEFFGKLHDLLVEDGIALVHTIGYSDAPGPISPFIRKHIFPGADLPSLSEITAAAERSGLIITDIEVLRLHYAETLHHWRKRFVAHWNDAARLYDERFCRMWEFYLALCEVGFRHRTNVVFQVQLARRLDAVPIIRDYIVDWERHGHQPARCDVSGAVTLRR
ncbi:class I SAM-dependent methyltransferase [Belnapia sp. T6]|uniref:Class I SAM-dependent methyltransferase n=1 Tax=Belnapia mucosa TaxID=2804532 RepID=A0ABS1VER4_9PROT|nr:cyclopropane-fatty-acyl-phospholipid synthase family protein [Belnapia mucosa]MBL6459214.1 class I SAM-dependent methyltransferase [Belnapia mucosa]